MKKHFITAAFLVPAVLSAGVKMTGKLDDPQWEKAPVFNQFYRTGSKDSAPPCEARVIHDDEAVYIGFKVLLGDGRKPVAEVTKRDGDVNHDDSVEVMIAPGEQRDRYAHVVVNSIGTILDTYADQGGFVLDKKWDGDITAKSFVGDGFWSTEICVPFSSLEMDGVKSPVWGFNFCCNRERGNWSSTAEKGTYHLADAFLKVGGFDLDYSRYALRVTPPVFTIRQDADGKYLIDVKDTIFNTLATPVKAKLDVTLKGKDIASSFCNVEAAPSVSSEVGFPVLSVENPGPYVLTVSVLDPVTRKASVRRNYPMVIEYNPLAITMKAPWYRNNIFATQKLENVVWKVTCSNALGPIITGIADESGKVVFKKELPGEGGEAEYPVASLPDGKYTVFAEMGKYRTAQTMRKLPYFKGEVWRDREGFWTVEGKRIFLIMEWNDEVTPGTLISTQPVDGRLHLNKKIMSSSGLAGKAVKGLKDPVLSKENEEIYRTAVRKEMNDENMFAWYLYDEPEIRACTVAAMVGASNAIRDVDPYHPVVVSNDTVAGMHDFAEATDINLLHPYPAVVKGKVRPGFNKVVYFMDEAAAANRTGKNVQTIAYLQQGFNYGDYGAVGRVPTFDEIRTQFWMSVIMGGRGITFYNRNTLHYPEIRIGTAEVGKEFAALHDVLVENDDPRGITSGSFRTMVKKHGEHLWVFAMSAQEEPFEREIAFPEFGDKKIHVWREGRTLQAENGRIKDSFSNYDVHIYTTDPDARGIRTCAEVEKEIADCNAARRKPGNLLFQNQEYDKLKFRASSNGFKYRRDDCSLWHVTDGINLGDIATKVHGLKMSFFKDNTPGKVPDWLEILLPAPEKMGRIVVYPAARSLKDYQVQIRKDGEWKTVGSVTDAQGESQTFEFAPETTDAIRIFITANRGKYSMIHEVEAYEK